ncbi:hypothetical protein PLICRDRAFT_701857 [Plicaturopsis crispa FD-325 SS-3]|uniref:Uncharacterized protein n=1 Tax=Plicaturopsis crispa FD-325 SS-3 TaxID=944288 RepID=A0A0C9T4Q4_PLICR|nr:hypothetical protein PLICRDRAFT_701857 [Plicaturopsis crispa FD-325 SS-3]
MVLKQEVVDAFATLGLDTDVSQSVASTAYKKLALKHHPDRNFGDHSANERFQEIGHAWSICLRHFENPGWSQVPEPGARRHFGRDYYEDEDDAPLDEYEAEMFFRFMFEEIFMGRFSRARGQRYRRQRAGDDDGGFSAFPDEFVHTHSGQQAQFQRATSEHDEFLRRVAEFEREQAEQQAAHERAARESYRDEQRRASFQSQAFQLGRAGKGADMRRMVEDAALDVTQPQKPPTAPAKDKTAKSKPAPKQFETMLHAAAGACDEETVAFLLARGADPAALDGAGLTPFHVAILRGNVPVVKYLLARARSTKVTDPAYQALAEGCHPSKAAKDKDARTPLQLAIAGKSADMVELLLKDATVHDVERCWEKWPSQDIRDILFTKRGFVPPEDTNVAVPLSKKALREKKAAEEKEKAQAEKMKRLAEEEENRRVKAERRAVQEANERRRREEAEAEERRRQAAAEEERQRQLAKERAEEEERRRLAAELEAQERVRRAAEERARREAAERAQREAERIRKETAARLRVEAEARARREEEERAREEVKRRQREREEKAAARQRAVEQEAYELKLRREREAREATEALRLKAEAESARREAELQEQLRASRRAEAERKRVEEKRRLQEKKAARRTQSKENAAPSEESTRSPQEQAAWEAMMRRRAEQSARDKARNQREREERERAAALEPASAEAPPAKKAPKFKKAGKLPKATTFTGPPPIPLDTRPKAVSPTPVSRVDFAPPSPPMTPEDLQTCVIPDDLFRNEAPPKPIVEAAPASPISAATPTTVHSAPTTASRGRGRGRGRGGFASGRPFPAERSADDGGSEHVGNGIRCRYYSRGQCARGSECAFSHAGSARAQNARPQTALEQELARKENEIQRIRAQLAAAQSP